MTLTLDRPDLAAALEALDLVELRAAQPGALPPLGHPHAPGLDVVGFGAQVPLVGGGSIEYANLDHAASAPALRVVKEAVDTTIERYASVHRGAGWHSQVCTSLYESARKPLREFVGGRADDVVLFTKHTTDSLNLLAHCLPPRTTVVVFETEHHAALLPWERAANVIRLAAPDSLADAVAAVDHALRTRPAGPALLVITGASNVTGEVWPVGQLAAVARARGAKVVLDAAQLAPHRPFSITELGVDWVALSGHKLYAPYGVGALIGRRSWLEDAQPYLIGGGATAHVGETTEWKPLPDRHEAGSPNVPGVVALATACHALSRTDRAGLAATEAALTERLRAGLVGISGVDVHTLFGTPGDCGTGTSAVDVIGVVTFTVSGLSAGTVAAALSAEYGIGVRDGAFCAHPLVRRLLDSATAAGCSTDGDGQAVRASVGLGSTAEHVDRLVGAIRELATCGPRLRYVLAGGKPVPADDDRVLPALPWAN